MPHDLNDINNDAHYWVDRCADVLDHIDLNDYTADQLADLAFVLETLRPPGSPLGGGSTPRVPRPTLTVVT